MFVNMGDLIKNPEFSLSKEEATFLNSELANVRDEFVGNQYIQEAVKVLSAGGYRSAIGSYWNAVVDDLRRKIIHRSLDLFNKEVDPKKKVKSYEDFQDHITDYDLIEGAYSIGVIGWEAKKLLHQARETRNIFDGHPSSSNPNIFKVLSMITDCNRYVLSQEYPVPIIEIDSYLGTMDSPNFAKNEIAIEQAFSDLPQIYKNELANKLYNSYLHDSSSTELRANIEFCLPILWGFLSKEDRLQIGKRVDKEIVNGDQNKIKKAIDFLVLTSNGLRYISNASRKGIFEPAVKKLEESLDDWAEEAKAVSYLERLGTIIPEDLLERYVISLILTFVGRKGYSLYYSRTDFYSDSAAPIIERLFERFDDRTADIFVNVVKSNEAIRYRINYPAKLNRLRKLANILLNRAKLRDDIESYLELMIDEAKTNDFLKTLKAAEK